MFGKLNHLAITSDRYTLLGMFYRAMFGLRASGDTAREATSVEIKALRAEARQAEAMLENRLLKKA